MQPYVYVYAIRLITVDAQYYTCIALPLVLLKLGYVITGNNFLLPIGTITLKNLIAANRCYIWHSIPYNF